MLFLHMNICALLPLPLTISAPPSSPSSSSVSPTPSPSISASSTTSPSTTETTTSSSSSIEPLQLLRNVLIRPLEYTYELGRSLRVARGKKGERLALSASSSGSTNSVHIVLHSVRSSGEVEINNHCDILHVQPSGRHIGRHQHAQLRLLKHVHHLRALELLLVSVQGVHGIARLPEQSKMKGRILSSMSSRATARY